jgi:aspartate aminotransferase
MSPRVSDLLSGLAPSATLAVDAKAKALKAAGEPVIGYGAGEPDFPTPAHIVEAAAKACYDPRNYKYTPTAGLAELRDAIVAKTKRDSGLEIKANQVLVTNGGKHAVLTTLMTLLNPGDEVLIPAPYWTTYPEAVYLTGATPVPVMTSEANGYRVTVDELEKARTAKTKLLIFVSPSNPTGAVVRPDAVAAIGRWAAEHDIWVMSDEIYEHLVYGDATFSSLPVAAPEIGDHWVVVNGVANWLDDQCA